MADIAAVGLMQERSVRESRVVVQQLQGALTSRVLIEQAKGVLAERARISLDAAFTRIRGYARANNLKISGVARDLLDGRLDPDELVRFSFDG
jgi:AmiR/NasT family two-component response regulator